MTEKEIKNQRIIIKNVKDNRIIADTKIIRYDSAVNSVYISAHSISDKKFYQVSVVIFAENCLYNFSGSMRGVIRENEMEVFLGKCETKEDRQAVRYSLVFEGSIEGVYIDTAKVRFHKPISVETIDMSSSGILLRAGAGFFQIGEKYSLLLKIKEDLLKMQCEIVRIQSDGTLTEEYGCRIEEVQWDRRKGMDEKPVMVYEGTYLDILADAYISDEDRRKAVEKHAGYGRLNQDIGSFFRNPNKESWLSKEKMEPLGREIAEKLIELDPITIFECMSFSRPMNEELQRHSLNVALLNGMQAEWMNMSPNRVEMFILAGLLHDAGKTMIPEELLNAPRSLTGDEMEVVRMHPIYSDRLLKDKFDDEIRSAARHHHEKLNGAGYPDGIMEDAIGLCARVTAISDIYDAMVSARSYKSSKLPLHILHMFYEEEFEGLDRGLVMNFIKNMRLKYTGKQVVMSDGGRGVIRYIPFNDAEHPIIQQGTRIGQTNVEWFCKAMLVDI